MMGSWKGRGNEYTEFIRDLYCKLPTNGKHYQLSHLRPCREANPGLRGGRRECYHSATVAPICSVKTSYINKKVCVNNVDISNLFKHTRQASNSFQTMCMIVSNYSKKLIIWLQIPEANVDIFIFIGY